MKKQAENNFKPLSKEQMEKLTTVTSETVAKPRTFSSAELWDIQRRSRTMTSRRYFA